MELWKYMTHGCLPLCSTFIKSSEKHSIMYNKVLQKIILYDLKNQNKLLFLPRTLLYDIKLKVILCAG